jgi:DNA modification methylase
MSTKKTAPKVQEPKNRKYSKVIEKTAKDFVRCSYDKMVKISDLKPNPSNRNVHPQDQIERLAELLRFHGIRKPVIVSTRSSFMATGHGSIEAAKLNGWTEYPVSFQEFIDDDHELSFGIADNAIALWAHLDLKGVNEDLATLDPSFKLDMLGLKDFVLEPADKDLGDPDAIPEATAIAKTRLGDVYQMGAHRLHCGDATKFDSVQKLLRGETPELVFTDPPYRMQVEGGSNQPIGKAAKRQGEMINHLCDFDPVAFLKNLSAVFPAGKMNAYVFCNKDLVPDYLQWAVEAGYSFNILFWKKPNAIPLGGSHRPDVEYLLLFRKSATWNNAVPNVSYSKCLEFGRDLSKDHPTVKPVDLITNELLISSSLQGVVLDLFGGSGSTLIACEKENRKARLMELEPRYCDVIVKRWENYTGLKATLVQAGQDE